MFLKVVIISIYIGLLSGCTGSLSAEKLFFQSVEKEFGPVNAYTIIFSDFPNEKETLVAILNTPDEELYSKGLPSAGEFGYSLFTTYLPFYAKTAAGDTLDRYLYSFNDLLDFLTAENPEGCFYWFYRPPSNDEVLSAQARKEYEPLEGKVYFFVVALLFPGLRLNIDVDSKLEILPPPLKAVVT